MYQISSHSLNMHPVLILNEINLLPGLKQLGYWEGHPSNPAVFSSCDMVSLDIDANFGCSLEYLLRHAVKSEYGLSPPRPGVSKVPKTRPR